VQLWVKVFWNLKKNLYFSFFISGNDLFVPDYTVQPLSDTVTIFRVRRVLYNAALQATLMEETKKLNELAGITENNEIVSIDDRIEQVGINNMCTAVHLVGRQAFVDMTILCFVLSIDNPCSGCGRLIYLSQ